MLGGHRGKKKHQRGVLPLVLRISQWSLAASVLLTGCASTVGRVSSTDVVGVTLNPSRSTSDESMPSAGKPPPELNQALADGASERTVSAYEHLLVTADLVLGDECGPELGSTSAWRALSILVHDRRPAMLWDLTARARAPESRAAAVIGLAKLRTISYADGRDLLRHMPGTLTICRGTTRELTRPDFAAEFLPRLLDGESNEVALP